MGCRMHARSLASFSSADSVASKFCLAEAPIDDELCLALASFIAIAHMNVNLQVVELEQHIIYRMMDVGRGVTKDRRTIYIYRIRTVHTRLCGARSGLPQLCSYWGYGQVFHTYNTF